MILISGIIIGALATLGAEIIVLTLSVRPKKPLTKEEWKMGLRENRW